ncbi:hypothetical protein [Microvirga massiliensis]|uniref:COG3904 family protein n=1 Tax=Microvirga massiliensis TaxID=1033741 RepID=UPI00062B8600|nr:hypothetical protein [Microvirga massiliensis]
MAVVAAWRGILVGIVVVFGAWVVAPVFAAEIRTIDHAELGIPLLQIEGDIAEGDERRVRMALILLKGRVAPDQLFVSLRSPGGVVETAIAIAEHLRQNGVGTVLLPGASCLSACAMIFFGGYSKEAGAPRRIAFAGSRLGVHRMQLRAKPRSGRSLMARDAELVETYDLLQQDLGSTLAALARIEMPAEILARMLQTPHEKMSVLSPAEMAAAGVTTVNPYRGGWRKSGLFLSDAALPPRLREDQSAKATPGIRRTQPLGTAEADMRESVALVEGLSGTAQYVAIRWTRSLSCLQASPEDGKTLGVRICLNGRKGAGINLRFDRIAIGLHDSPRPDFPGPHRLEFHDGARIRASVDATLTRSDDESASFTVRSDEELPLLPFGALKRLVLDLKPLTITLAPPAALVDAAWGPGLAATGVRTP